MTNPLWVIIPAAGVGKRMQSHTPKQYLQLQNQTILDRTIGLFLRSESIAGVAVGLSDNDGYWPQSQWYQDARVKVFKGGAERSDTVLNGLMALEATLEEGASVLVHDAARPLLSQAALARIADYEGEQGALLAMPSRDTVKQSSHQHKVMSTVDRNHIWLAQTPQKFPARALQQALLAGRQQNQAITDESSAMELMGWQPQLIEGESRNIKITLPEDILIAEALLSKGLC
ncbi:2-C-methyl-D-erythritol 4-phosphate cytidylyltransferase [Marinomonas epiphytica]